MINATNRPMGNELGLQGGYTSMMPVDIVENARDCFASLSSRIDIVKGGPAGKALAREPAWSGILQEVAGMIVRFPAIADNAVAAAAFADEVLDLEKEIDQLMVIAECELEPRVNFHFGKPIKRLIR